MNEGEKKFICGLLVIIVICCLVLAIKMKNSHSYDKELYNEIYSEYEEIFENKVNSDNTETVENENQEQSESTNASDKKIQMITNSQGEKYRVVGKIRIPKIKVNYPIIYETSDEYLKMAPTKFCGPDVNEVGNLCIAGHNYYNDEFFSNASELEIGDKIFITSYQRKDKTYIIYDKYTVSKDDLSCTSQDTNGKIEVTLITCVKFDKSKRLIIKARTDY